MTDRLIDASYLRGFFGIPDTPEGNAEVAELQQKLERIEYRHGQDICTIDGEADGMYFLESGTAVVLDRDGQQINIMHEGQYFGEYGVLSGQRRLSTVRSHGKTLVYRLSSSDMMDTLRRHPDTYGELMKRVYAQVTQKHKELLTLSRIHRGVLQHPNRQAPLTLLQTLLRYGAVALLMILSLILLPANAAFPVFVLPLLFMLVYVLLTRQTIESLIISGIYAALLYGRSGLAVSYTDAFLETFGNADNIFTVFVMALIGGFVALIEASGAVTALRKTIERRCRDARGLKLTIFAILLVTAIDDFLGELCASGSTNRTAEKQRVTCEERALLLSFLPTVMCSFIPISLWAIFVIGSINPNAGGEPVSLFIRAIPFNFFSIVTLVAMLLFCFDRLPLSRQLKDARARAEQGGPLWPEGSERFLLQDDGEVWGRSRNLLLPVAVLALASLTLRSVFSHSFALDSACGLVAALIFMFLLYCAQGLMSPEQFTEHLISGIQSMAMPIILYLLTMCLSSLLNQHAMGEYFDDAVFVLEPISSLLPSALFLISMLFTVALGSSWAMYAIAFPVAIRMALAVGIHVPLCVGAVCSAGIAGEMLCIFTSDSTSVGASIGCNPSAVLGVRIPYGIAFSVISLLLYIAAGFLIR